MDYTALNVVFDPTAPSTTIPGGVVRGTFDYRNAGTDGGDPDGVLDGLRLAQHDPGRFGHLDRQRHCRSPGRSDHLGGAVNFSGNWPLDYGSYYLLIMVSEIEDVNGANDRVASARPPRSGCSRARGREQPRAQRRLTNLLIVYDLGVSMEPGMSLYLEGSMAAADVDDVIGVKSGTATTLTASMAWGANEDIALYIWAGPAESRRESGEHDQRPPRGISWTPVPGRGTG